MIADLKVYAGAGLNVLLIGPHGSGKSHMIREVFNERFGEMNTDWLYLPCSTMDPWINLIGIPRVVKLEGFGHVTQVAPPEKMVVNDIKAIFLDEFNRSPKEIRDACMELLQFGSINGRRLKNLQVVWAAINPFDEEDSEYEVEPIDPAHLDRFECKIPIKPDPSLRYFKLKYGDDGAKAVEWWRALPSNGKKQISARRLEAITNALRNDIPIHHMVPENISYKSLEAKVKDSRRVNSMLTMLSDEKVPQEAKRAEIQKAIRTRQGSDVVLGDVRKIVGDEMVYQATLKLDGSPDRQLLKNSSVMEFAEAYETKKEAGGEGVWSRLRKEIVPILSIGGMMSLKKGGVPGDLSKGIGGALFGKAAIEVRDSIGRWQRDAYKSGSDPFMCLSRILDSDAHIFNKAAIVDVMNGVLMQLTSKDNERFKNGIIVPGAATIPIRNADFDNRQDKMEALCKLMIAVMAANMVLLTVGLVNAKDSFRRYGLKDVFTKLAGCGDIKKFVKEIMRDVVDKDGGLKMLEYATLRANISIDSKGSLRPVKFYNHIEKDFV